MAAKNSCLINELEINKSAVIFQTERGVNKTGPGYVCVRLVELE